MLIKFISLLLFTSLSLSAYAEGMFTTLKTLLKNDITNNAYISAGYPFNTTRYEKDLDILWESIEQAPVNDSYGQPWKTVEISKLKKILGHIPEEYYVITPTITNKEENKKTIYSVTDLKYTFKKVHHAALFKWGCDNSVTPVLSLGVWNEEINDWGTVPVAVSRITNWRFKRQAPTFGKVDSSALPPALLPGVNDSSVGFSINWANENLSASIVLDPIHRHYTLFSVQQGFSYLESKSPFDVSC